VLAIIVGFPIALVMAWAFELTPEGLKRTEDVDAAAAAQRPRHHAWIFVVIIAGAMSLGLFFLGRFTAPSKQSGANEVSSKSIAVLPFVNMSSDKEQEYFSDGLSEELLNQLAQIPQLRVIARTSSFSFKGKEVDVATIAKALNVANVLEGSVRKSANTLRVTAQLVRTSDSSNLWSQTYERQMTDVFKVQDEIASDVVAALKVKLLPTQQLPNTQRTNNTEAYEHYLLGMDISAPELV
jgi:TolB-like protein